MIEYINEKQIAIEGDLSRRRLKELKEWLPAELMDSEVLRINIARVTVLDLSTLQWIYAFGCAASSEGKEVIIKINLPNELEELVRISGIRKMFNCFEERNKQMGKQSK